MWGSPLAPLNPSILLCSVIYNCHRRFLLFHLNRREPMYHPSPNSATYRSRLNQCLQAVFDYFKTFFDEKLYIYVNKLGLGHAVWMGIWLVKYPPLCYLGGASWWQAVLRAVTLPSAEAQSEWQTLTDTHAVPGGGGSLPRKAGGAQVRSLYPLTGVILSSDGSTFFATPISSPCQDAALGGRPYRRYLNPPLDSVVCIWATLP